MLLFVAVMALTPVPSLLSFGGAPVLQRCKCGWGLAAGTGALPVQSWDRAERGRGGEINQAARSVWEIRGYLGWEVCSAGETDHGECLNLPGHSWCLGTAPSITNLVFISCFFVDRPQPTTQSLKFPTSSHTKNPLWVIWTQQSARKKPKW